MNKIIFAAMLVVGSGVANAADIIVDEQVPVAPAPIIMNWAGFYIGGNIGYGWGDATIDTNPLPNPAAFGAAPFSVDVSPDGVIGGGQIGYNWQAGPWVYGVETDIQAAHLQSSETRSPLSTDTGAPVPGWNSVAEAELNYWGTIRGRLGYTILPETLAYVTGGWAYGEVDSSSLTTFTPTPAFTYRGSDSSFQHGWTVGGGVEQAFGNNWTMKVEYLYVQIDGPDYVASPLAPNPPFRLSHQLDDITLNVARVGFNYKF